ncbi:hypothetical protein ACWX0K_14765 [Nitrobacteraceae bacterium UC4446_H13]
MTPAEWEIIKDRVTNEMLNFTRPFVTPLGTTTPTTVRLVGTGSYVKHDGNRLLLTCEHVAREQPMHYRFYNSEDVYSHRGPWRMDRHPVDAAVALIDESAWQARCHEAKEIPNTLFARVHSPCEQAELLFFRGFSGENAHYAFGTHQTNGTGYCSQEVANSGDRQIFEMFWKPEKTQFSSSTSDEARLEIKFENPAGLSGSLVWNTRYLEVTNAGKIWSPADAVVTGLLRRWDNEDTGNLLVWRVEHLNTWL